MKKSTPPLLRLPPELRITLFETFLDETFLQTQRHPEDPVPPHSKFGSYLSLILSCRQMHDEVEELFQKAYAHRTLFYFEEASQLYNFIHHMGNFPNPHEAWVKLSSSKTQLQSRLGFELLR